MSKSPHDTALGATLTGISDIFKRKDRIGKLSPDDRIDGLSCMVTGANSGLGKAVAIELARRGGRIMMAGRSYMRDARREICKKSGSREVYTEHIDLADLDSIRDCVEQLAKRGWNFDIVIINAGVVPKEARFTKQGFEEMFQVNYLSNFHLISLLLEKGLIPNRVFGTKSTVQSKNKKTQKQRRPRIIFVSSETHRSAGPINFERIGSFSPYGPAASVAEYGYTKLLLTSFASELSRRLIKDGDPEVSVHSLCPGAVNTRIAREAPFWAQPILKLFMMLFFKSPRKASEPVVYLSCSEEIEGKTGIYLHVMNRKPVSKEAADPENGRRLWEKSEALLEAKFESAHV